MKIHRSTFHQTLAVIPVCLGEFLLGTGYGWLAPMIRIFLEDPISEMQPTKDDCSWIGSLPNFGRIFGPLFSILLLDVLGRKLMIQLAIILLIAPWLAILFTSSVLLLCIGFFIFGLGVGLCNAVMAVYLGENCSPKMRGVFCSASVTCFYVAVLLQYTITGYLSFRTVAAVNATLVCFGLVIATLLAVESSQFLILRNKFDKAEANMMWLRGTDNKDDINIDFENIKSNIASEKLKKTSYKELFLATANFKSLIIVITLNIAHALAGNAALFTFISILFPPNEFFSSTQIMILFGISQFAFCLLASFVIERFNRRSLTLFSFTLFVVCHAVNSYFFYDSAKNTSSSSSLLSFGIWVAFGAVYLCSGFSAILDSVVHIVRGELFPHSIKPIGSGLSISAHSFMQFVTIKIFLEVKLDYGVYMNFVGYAAISFASIWFVYFALPETRGKTLIDIQKSLEKFK